MKYALICLFAVAMLLSIIPVIGLKENQGAASVSVEDRMSPAGVSQRAPAGIRAQSAKALPVSPASTVEEALESLVSAGGLAPSVAAEVRQSWGQTLRAARELTRASRRVTEIPSHNTRVFDFPVNRESVNETLAHFTKQVSAMAGKETSDAILNAIVSAAQSDPSVDLGVHHRRIVMRPGESGEGWQVTDQTFTTDGYVLASNSVFPTYSEEGELIWPDEYLDLLGD